MISEFIEYIKKGTTPFTVVASGAEVLNAKGFTQLDLAKEWRLNAGQGYYVNVYGTTLLAFVAGSSYESGMPIHIAAAHTDHPCFRVKPSPEMADNGYLKLDVECYGGAILSTWLDRPLSIAGKVALRSDEIYNPRTVIVDFKRPLLTIPNLAIHMNRDANKGQEYNKQTELLPIAGLIRDELSRENFFMEYLAKEIGADAADILDFDLYIYNAEESCALGLDNELMSAPRLDNLTSCYACLNGICSDRLSDDRLSLIALYDNEEVGSRSKQGADSSLLRIILEKIYKGLGYDVTALNEAIFKSMALSVDVAHAYHPNYPGKSDPNNKVICGEGFAIKLNYSQKYATDTEAAASVMQLCDKNSIPFQKYVNRSDIAGGGTIGSILSAQIPMRTVDIGVPILAMHSSRELMAASDLEALRLVVEAFFH